MRHDRLSYERHWCENCCRPDHKEDTCLKNLRRSRNPRQNTRSRGTKLKQNILPRIVHSTPNKWSNSIKSSLAFKHLANLPSSSLAHKGNFQKTLCMSQYKFWIIDSSASRSHDGLYHLFSSYSTCTGNIKVKIVDSSLSSVEENEIFESLIS